MFLSRFGVSMLYELADVIEDRKQNTQPGSYTSQLFSEGEDAILKKVGEEAMEVILAAKGQGKQRLVEEVADLFYHTLVLLSWHDLSLTDVEEELRRRRR